MRYVNGTARVLLVYMVFLLVGQALSVAVGLALDPYSKTVALATFIPLYYGMFWFAWRAALFIADRSEDAAQSMPAGTKVGVWLFAPAVLALDICD